MPSGRCSRIDELSREMRALLEQARRGALATIGGDGTPHVVPVCYAIRGAEIVLEVDDKPKRDTKLQRVRNIEANPRVSLLADHWDENWTRLGWVMVRGVARIEAPGGASEVLRAKYIQYDTTDLGGPVVAIEPQIINWWTWT